MGIYFEKEFEMKKWWKLSDGAIPKDDNEIVIGSLVSEKLNKRVNDKIKIKDEEFAIEEGKKVIDKVGLSEFMDVPAGNLAYGVQRRVEIARALALNPEILLLDEPTAALDFRVERAIMDLIRRLHQEKDLTILLVTHKMTFLREYTTRVVCLDKSIIWQGNPMDPKLQTIIDQLFFL